ncbi:hypothetical protein PP744_gp095 [Rhizobium phage RHph_N38]|uniref:Uncharacterized protein n=1 Tax=Rhizobium phage RHph_N38 TaxID=2509750 RepID=A0A7S5UTZ0_9CAUD|nr:hypothetical protein PP744_gp095 [Rhizobium phage RHph_N38]QIG70560.1 hypothetical protein EVB89_099 [Rhizobium phage RHph_N38]
MKEPSELDITLVRDLAYKMRGGFITDGEIEFALPLKADLINEIVEALLRVIDSYRYMSDEITRLVLEKHQRD